MPRHIGFVGAIFGVSLFASGCIQSSRSLRDELKPVFPVPNGTYQETVLKTIVVIKREGDEYKIVEKETQDEGGKKVVKEYSHRAQLFRVPGAPGYVVRFIEAFSPSYYYFATIEEGGKKISASTLRGGHFNGLPPQLKALTKETEGGWLFSDLEITDPKKTLFVLRELAKLNLPTLDHYTYVRQK
jgi:hypothetical protein